MKLKFIFLSLALSMFVMGNANANFIGPFGHGPSYQQVPQHSFFTLKKIGIFHLKGNDKLSFFNLKCRKDCSTPQTGNNGSTAVPEPSTMLLTLLGLAGLGISKRKQRA